MRLDWLDDLVALVECESVTLAAEHRHVSQSAFSRRLQRIEQWLGVPLVDRSTRPARASNAICNQLADIRVMAGELRGLRSKAQIWQNHQEPIVIASQHTLTVVVLPRLIARLRQTSPDIPVKLYSGNRDEIFTMLMTNQAMMLMSYETDSILLSRDNSLIEKQLLAVDRFIPVCSAKKPVNLSASSINELKIISYPEEVFFGSILHRQLLPELRKHFAVSTICEATLVPAVIELAKSGLGVAWLPELFVKPNIADGSLYDLSSQFGAVEMRIVVARLNKKSHSSLVDFLWSNTEKFARDN